MEKLWVEKYRPKTIEQVIFQDDAIRAKFKEYLKSKEIPNLLLSGVQGSGKTTLSRVLVRELNIDPADILIVNASDENSIDDMRNKIKNFAYNIPIGKFKVVQLEECDYLSHAGQSVLRSIIEDTTDVTRFIATCNYDNKLMPAIKSRFQHIKFKAPDYEHVTIRMAEILAEEGVEFEIDLLDQFVRAAYPDIRSIINLIEQFSEGGVLRTMTSSNSSTDWKFKLLDLMNTSDFRAMRKLVCENSSKEEYEDIFRFMYDNIQKCKKFQSVEKQEEAIITIADYLYKNSMVSDQEINIAAMFISLGNL